MAIDLDKIKSRLTKLEDRDRNRGQQGPSIKDYVWKPEPGKTLIRIVPYVHDTSIPFQELKFHYNIGKRPYLSPTTVGEADPIAELAEELRAKKDKDPEDIEMLKTLTPSTRTYVPIVVRGEEADGVKFWGFGKNAYMELMSYFVDPDYGDLSDPENGRNVEVEFIPKEQNGGHFPKTNIKVKPSTSPIATSDAILEKVADQPKLVGELFKVPTYEELEEVLNTWLDGETNEQSQGTAEEDDLPWKADGSDKTPQEASIAAQFAKLTGKS